jgi:hypothetical protein
MTNGEHLSSGLFAIAEEVGIPLRPGTDEPLQEQQYEAFCEKYRSWAHQRDILLKEHLGRTRQTFRTLIPRTPRAHGVAYQVQWYFDEILIRDPVGLLVEQEPKDQQLEDRKIQLCQTIQGLASFLPAIRAGYLVLYGQGAREQPSEIDPQRLEDLAARPEIAKALTAAIRWGLELRTADDGRQWDVFQADLDVAKSYGWHVTEPQGGTTSPAIRVGEKLSEVSPQEVERVLGAKTVEQASGLFPTEIEGTLHNYAVATSMSAIPLFDRQVDGVIIESASNIPEGAFTPVRALNLTLPYLEGVSADALIELRQDDPEAFAEFRLLMNDLVRRAQTGRLTEPLEQAAAREILPHLRKLEGEFEALKRTRRYAAVLGLAAIVGGGLAGVLLAPVAAPFAAVAVPAAASLLGSFEKEGALVTNPFYWLWRARR